MDSLHPLVFDLMGIWFRDASLETFKNIISESPSWDYSMMITEKPISKAQSMGSDFILAQEFSRGDNIMICFVVWDGLYPKCRKYCLSVSYCVSCKWISIYSFE